MRWIKVVAGLLTVLAGCVGCTAGRVSRGSPDQPAAVTVYAASSLTEAFGALGHIYEDEHGGTVKFSFESSSTLANQVVEGAPADVFASADALQMEVVQEEGLARDPVPFATNRLVVITPEDNPRGLEAVGDLAAEGIKLILAGPDVPAGNYAREMFGRLGILREAEGNVVSNEEDVKAVVAKVRLGEADVGVVYRTDVTAGAERDLGLIEVPRAVSPRAVYPIAILSGAPNPQGGRAFLDLLTSDTGSRVLRRHGFGLP